VDTGFRFSGVEAGRELGGCAVPEGGLAVLAVVEDLDELEEVEPSVVAGLEPEAAAGPGDLACGLPSALGPLTRPTGQIKDTKASGRSHRQNQ
jgi:hypothetical protein